MNIRQMADSERFRTMTTPELRGTFLFESLAKEGSIELVYVDLDRTVLGFAVPTTAELKLDAPPQLRAEYFLERRELGILNVGGSGSVHLGNETFSLEKLDCLYLGRGVQNVRFASRNADDPACFYLLSYPAHADHPTALVRAAELKPLELGANETCNSRRLYKAIHRDGIQSCQLVMGFTLLNAGSNWNTMPPHTHFRRSEVYLYFDVDPAQRVLHLMGPPEATRNLWLADREVVVSPGWSIHAGVGTKAYGFCWGMGGENQDYTDMEPAAIPSLR